MRKRVLLFLLTVLILFGFSSRVYAADPNVSISRMYNIGGCSRNEVGNDEELQVLWQNMPSGFPTDYTVSATSSDSTVVSVVRGSVTTPELSDGAYHSRLTINYKKAGNATITVYANKGSARYEGTIEINSSEKIYEYYIRLYNNESEALTPFIHSSSSTTSTITMQEGESVNVRAFVYLACGSASYVENSAPGTSESSDDVTWKSSNTSVFTVKNGKITAVGPGTANLTASKAGTSTSNDVKSATIKVKVTANPVTTDDIKIVITGDNSLKVGETKTLKATVTKNGTVTTTPRVTWKSNNTSILTVNSSTGEITGIAPGKTTVTVSYPTVTGKDVDAKEDIEITVLADGESSSGSIDASSKKNPATGVFASIAAISLLLIGGISILFVNRKKKLFKI